MNKSIIDRLPEEVIMNKIYIIRGHKVMLDKDLAELYEVETKRLKEQVKRNIERFPSHFMFELTEEENEALRSQIATLKRGEHSKYLPYAFTEHGVLMLSNVLKGSRAIAVSIKIIDVFVKLRKALTDYTELHLMIEELRKSTETNTKSIDIIFQCLDRFVDKEDDDDEPRKLIGYKSQ
jgi:phage regulator Rha-like protein